MSITVAELNSVSVCYPGMQALDRLSLTIQAGECVVILGPNGAGKTTLLSLLNGFVAPDSGSVRLWGSPLKRSNLSRIRQRIGHVAQTQPIDPRMPITLRESVMTGLYGRLGWRRRPSRTDLDLVASMLEDMGLSALSERPLGKLSGGEMRRAMIARALVQRPELLLMDEPTASLDEASRATVLALLERLYRRGGLTLIWVTHDLEALPEPCTRILRMHTGRIVYDGAAPGAFGPAPGSGLSRMLVSSPACV